MNVNLADTPMCPYVPGDADNEDQAIEFVNGQAIFFSACISSRVYAGASHHSTLGWVLTGSALAVNAKTVDHTVDRGESFSGDTIPPMQLLFEGSYQHCQVCGWVRTDGDSCYGIFGLPLPFPLLSSPPGKWSMKSAPKCVNKWEK